MPFIFRNRPGAVDGFQGFSRDKIEKSGCGFAGGNGRVREWGGKSDRKMEGRKINAETARVERRVTQQGKFHGNPTQPTRKGIVSGIRSTSENSHAKAPSRKDAEGRKRRKEDWGKENEARKNKTQAQLKACSLSFLSMIHLLFPDLLFHFFAPLRLCVKPHPERLDFSIDRLCFRREGTKV
jgi:hypothetical protein